MMKSKIDKGITTFVHGSKRYKITRKLNQLGLYYYSLENISKKEVININQEHFHLFRSFLLAKYEESQNDFQYFDDLQISFSNQLLFKINIDKKAKHTIALYEVEPKENSTGCMTIPYNAFSNFLDFLYQKDINFPCESLERIIYYNRAYQMSFEENTESITSNLSFKKDFFFFKEKYQTKFDTPQFNSTQSSSKFKSQSSIDAKKIAAHDNQFTVKLGQKTKSKDKTISFEKLFAGKEKEIIEEQTKRKRRKTKSSQYFELPLLASEIKTSKQKEYICELDQDEKAEFRKMFPLKTNNLLYMGFEIIDLIYKQSGQFKTFKFPLYYMPVDIIESGHTMYLNPKEGQKIYLNHLAIVNAVQSLTDQRISGDPIEQFLQLLQKQVFKFDHKFEKIRLQRYLPISDTIYQKQREIITGLSQSEDDRGLFTNLRIIGIETDLETVLLYQPKQELNIVNQNLNYNLDLILKRAQNNPTLFYESLCGQFLVPEKSKNTYDKIDYHQKLFPGRASKSMGQITDKLDQHNILLLEGPPGTGKTFSILNILIHCICTDKRVLIVSDKSSAIDALTEKIQDYLLGKDRQSLESKFLDQLWQSTLKIIKELNLSEDYTKFAQTLDKNVLFNPNLQINTDLPDAADIVKDIKYLDQDIASQTKDIQEIIFSHTKDFKKGHSLVAKKNYHPTTTLHIKSLILLIKHLKDSESKLNDMLKNLFNQRLNINSEDYSLIYKDIEFHSDLAQTHLQKIQLQKISIWLSEIIKQKPKNIDDFIQLSGDLNESGFYQLIIKKWNEWFDKDQMELIQQTKHYLAYVYHPVIGLIKSLSIIVNEHLEVLEQKEYLELSVSLEKIHTDLLKRNHQHIYLDTELYKHFLINKNSPNLSVQEILSSIEKCYRKRDDKIKQMFLSKLNEIFTKVTTKSSQNNTSPLTYIQSILNELKKYPNPLPDSPVLADLQKALAENFPIWICQKQMVPLLFPCEENLFDLVVVDEATQCRVDDALPLIYRANKIIAVGDDKQTVLDKNSVLDDFLFNEYNLLEHLRSSQSSAVKGGGSHLFALIKNIKNTEILLNEHYRCPPEIIQFSNNYVYDNKLDIMQWKPADSPSSIVIDHSEKNSPSSERAKSGKYKGIETQMIDRFFDFITEEVAKIEKEFKIKINSETDLAICYFLLKNNPYFEDKKSQFLEKLKRGNDILHGAGAALQGKERDFMFYFWDITSFNMMAFSQGDDELKRKGELNVLMSRPKIRSYHYLHKNFDKINHQKANIADFLWKKLNLKQNQNSEKYTERTQDPGVQYYPWNRGSGQLIRQLLSIENQIYREYTPQYSIKIGSPKYTVDLIISEFKQNLHFAFFDLSNFEYHPEIADEVVDYYFQLKRSSPKILPQFYYIYELLYFNGDEGPSEN